MWISKKEFHQLKGELEIIHAGIRKQRELLPGIIYDENGKKYWAMIDRYGLITYSDVMPEYLRYDDRGTPTKVTVDRFGTVTYQFDDEVPDET